MRKSSPFLVHFWDSPLRATLRHLGPEHLWVYLHLAHGPHAEVSGIYRVSIGQIAEDTELEPDHVRAVIEDLCDTGWCEYEPPVVWIRGVGNINDRLGTDNFRKNPSWVKATERHLEALPQNRVVTAFRTYHFGVHCGNHRDEMGTGCRQGTETLATGPSNPFLSYPNTFPFHPAAKTDPTARDYDGPAEPTGSRRGGAL